MTEMSPEAKAAAIREIGLSNYLAAHVAVPIALTSGMLAVKSFQEGEPTKTAVAGVVFLATMGVRAYAARNVSCDYYATNWQETCKNTETPSDNSLNH